MRFKLVQTLQEAMQLRVLRNACRQFLTNEKKHIGIPQQCRWYFQTYRAAQRAETYRAYLLFNESGMAAGYGALALEEGALLATECVGPQFRGQGYGRLILEHLMEIATTEKRNLVADIWASNKASIALHESAGFRLVSCSLKRNEELIRYELVAEVIRSSRSELRERNQIVA